ncbi:uncharacterized protein FFMR_11802 [Fusarium fujikuroi]|nr:uncharacterized protein FFMR_11802 [Fusarium fujikuroi]
MGLLEWLQQPRSAVSTLAVLQKLLVLRRYCTIIFKSEFEEKVGKKIASTMLAAEILASRALVIGDNQ